MRSAIFKLVAAYSDRIRSELYNVCLDQSSQRLRKLYHIAERIYAIALHQSETWEDIKEAVSRLTRVVPLQADDEQEFFKELDEIDAYDDKVIRLLQRLSQIALGDSQVRDHLNSKPATFDRNSTPAAEVKDYIRNVTALMYIFKHADDRLRDEVARLQESYAEDAVHTAHDLIARDFPHLPPLD